MKPFVSTHRLMVNSVVQSFIWRCNSFDLRVVRSSTTHCSAIITLRNGNGHGRTQRKRRCRYVDLFDHWRSFWFQKIWFIFPGTCFGSQLPEKKRHWRNGEKLVRKLITERLEPLRWEKPHVCFTEESFVRENICLRLSHSPSDKAGKFERKNPKANTFPYGPSKWG